MRVLGLDYGSARLGVALGDTETRIASPWCVLDMGNREKAIQELNKIIQEEKVDRIVLGIPRPLRNQVRSTPQTEEVLRFRQELESIGLPIEEENETWSTKLAARFVHDLEQTGKRDDLAAVVILQSYLDRYGLSA